MSTESLYGIKILRFLPDVDRSDSREITLPKVSKDLLMLAPSCTLQKNKNKKAKKQNKQKPQPNTVHPFDIGRKQSCLLVFTDFCT